MGIRNRVPRRFRPVVLGVLVSWCFIPDRARAQDENIHDVYLTRDQALALAFPDGEKVRSVTRMFTPEEKQAVAGRLGQTPREDGFVVWIGEKAGRLSGYAVIVDEIGKFHPITFMVAVTPTGAVRNVGIMVYRESRGSEVRNRRFLGQYAGKTGADPVRVDRDILKISGATMSANAVCRGVRKILAFLGTCYVGKSDSEILGRGGVAPPPPADAGRGDRAPAPRLVVSDVAPDVLRVRRAELHMGAVCEIDAFAPEGSAREALEGAVTSAFAEIARLEGILSHWRPDSELSRLLAKIENGKANMDQSVSPDLFAVLERSRHWSEKSGGAFDVTVGPAVKAWGFTGGPFRVPSDAELDALRSRVGWRRIVLNREPRTVNLEPGVAVDFGAIGKGFAIDRAVDALRRAGVSAAAVNFSGNLYLLGAPPGEAGWPVDVADPRDPGRTLGRLALRDRGVSSSGNYEKRFESGGKPYGHILDPRTLRPVEGVAGTTVVAANATDADALSTAVFVLGSGEGIRFLDREKAGEGLLVRSDGTTEATPGWPALLAPGTHDPAVGGPGAK